MGSLEPIRRYDPAQVAKEQGVDPVRIRETLESQVHDGDRYLPFGDITPLSARAQAERLGSVGTWGPLQRVAKVSHAWKLLAAQMERDGAGSVRELEASAVVEHAERLWIISPKGGMVEGMRG